MVTPATHISYEQIIEWGALPECEQIARLRQRYPEGIPLTREVGRVLLWQDYPVVDFAVRLLDEDGVRAFRLFTLRQRQPHMVTLFRAAGLAEHAEAIAALTWDDLTRAQTVLASARDAAGNAGNAAFDTFWSSSMIAAWDAKRAAFDTSWVVSGADAGYAAGSAAWVASKDGRAAATREQLEWISDRLGLPEERVDLDR